MLITYQYYFLLVLSPSFPPFVFIPAELFSPLFSFLSFISSSVSLPQGFPSIPSLFLSLHRLFQSFLNSLLAQGAIRYQLIKLSYPVNVCLQIKPPSAGLGLELCTQLQVMFWVCETFPFYFLQHIPRLQDLTAG